MLYYEYKNVLKAAFDELTKLHKELRYYRKTEIKNFVLSLCFNYKKYSL